MLELFRRIIRKLEDRKYDEFNRAELFRAQGAKIGNNCRIMVSKIATEPWLVEIGDRVTISGGVILLTHDGGAHVFREEIPTLQYYGKIKIGNNCVLGSNVIITPGVTIGDNCVVGAGSVVTHDTPDNKFVFGVPARPIMPIEKYKEKFVEGWKVQKPPGYGDSLDPDRLNDVEYVAKALSREIPKIREHFRNLGII